MNITVVGTGYVGLSLSVLLSKKFKVIAFDIDKKKIDLINSRKSLFKDKEIEEHFLNRKLNLEATNDKNKAFKDAFFIIIATPTNYDEATGNFDTSSVESVISDAIKLNNKVNIVIKSTIPFGFTEKIKTKFNYKKIFFSPEFLREGTALYDNLYPSRIIVGDKTTDAKKFADILKDSALQEASQVKIHFMSSMEAEAVKLFANSYLATRVAFFNELDTFLEVNGLSAKKVIEGVSDDPRIGNFYNNPSFGYGGYCLPKDIKQLLQNFKDVPSDLIKATIDSNLTRKKFIVNSILNRKPKIVGVYRLAMKVNADNFRESAVIDIIKILVQNNITINLYEPNLKESDTLDISNVHMINDLDKFIQRSELIMANRMDSKLEHVINKVYTRDIFRIN